MKFMFYTALGLLAVSLVTVVTISVTLAVLIWGGV